MTHSLINNYFYQQRKILDDTHQVMMLLSFSPKGNHFSPPSQSRFACICMCVCVCVLSLYILSFRFIHDALCIHHSFIFIGFHFLKIYPCLLIDNCVVAMLTITDRGNCFLYMLGTYIFIFTG